MATRRTALRLDPRDLREVDSRARSEARERRDRVVAVGVDDNERKSALVGAIARAHAHRVLIQGPHLRRVATEPLPALGKAHLLLPVDVRTREREERYAVRAVKPLGFGENAAHFF